MKVHSGEHGILWEDNLDEADGDGLWPPYFQRCLICNFEYQTGDDYSGPYLDEHLEVVHSLLISVTQDGYTQKQRVLR